MFRPLAGRHQAALIKTYMEESKQYVQFSVPFTGVTLFIKEYVSYTNIYVYCFPKARCYKICYHCCVVF